MLECLIEDMFEFIKSLPMNTDFKSRLVGKYKDKIECKTLRKDEENKMYMFMYTDTSVIAGTYTLDSTEDIINTLLSEMETSITQKLDGVYVNILDR